MQKQTYKIMKILIVLMMMFTILPTRVRNIIAENNIIVSFNTNGGSEVDSQIIEVGTTATRPIDPTKENYNFVDWYTNDDIPFDFNQTLNEDITLNAKWEEIIQETIEEVNNNQEETVLTNNDEVVEQGNNNEEIVLDNNQTPALRNSGGTRAITHTITLHYSSIDNDELATPIVINNVAHGSQIRDSLDLLEEKFTVDGYVDSMFRTPYPLSHYSTWDSINDDFSLTDEVTEDLHIYYLAGIETNNVGINLDLPEINSSTSGTGTSQTQRPNVSLGGMNYLFTDYSNFWLTSSSGMSFFEGTFEEGETYYAFVQLKPLFPYLFGDNPTVSVNNGTIASKETNKELVKVYIGVTLGNTTLNHTMTFNINGGSINNNVWPSGSQAVVEETNNCNILLMYYPNEKMLIFASDVLSVQAQAIAPTGYEPKSIVITKGNNSTTYTTQNIVDGGTLGLMIQYDINDDVNIDFNWEEIVLKLGTGRSDGGIIKVEGTKDNLPVADAEDGLMHNFSIPYGSNITLTATPNENYEFVGWYKGVIGSSYFVEDYDEDELISTNSTYNYQANEDVLIYGLFTKKKYNVSFVTRNSDTIPNQEIEIGNTATKPSDPTPPHQTLSFRGWYEVSPTEMTSEDISAGWFTFNTPITDNKTLYAVYEGVLYIKTYNLSNNTQNSGGNITYSSIYVSETNPLPNVATTVIEGTTISLTAIPDNGYEFVGWAYTTDKSYAVSTSENYELAITQGDTIYALFEKEIFNVTFDTNGGSQIDSKTIEAGSTVDRPEEDPTKTNGLVFDNWYTDNTYSQEFDFTKPITEDTTIYARWKGLIGLNAYDLLNSSNGGGKVGVNGIPGDTSASSWIYENDSITISALANEDREFVGWSTSTSKDDVISTDASYTFTYTKAQNLYALFDIKKLTVTFESNGGDAIESQTIDYGSKATKPSDPTKTNLTFKEWVDEEGVTFDFDTEITKDITLTAKYKGRLEMVAWSTTTPQGGYGRGGSVSANKGTSVPPSGVDGVAYEIDEGEEVTITATASDNYEFVCWSTSNSENDAVSNNASYTFTFDKNTTLIAIFKEFKPELILHFSSIDGDDLLDPIRYEFTYTVGITVGQVLEANGKDMDGTFFTLDGYCDYEEIVAPKPLSEYTSLYEAYDDRILKQQVLENKDTHLYVLMAKELNEAEISIEAPKHKEETSVPEGGYYYEDQINPPKVSAPDNDFYKLDDSSDYLPAVWVNEDGDEYEGEFIAGNDYYAEIWLEAKFGYVFSDDPTISVNGGEVIEKYPDYDYFGVLVKVKAEKRKYTLTFNLDGGTYNGKSTYTVEYEDGDKIKLPKPTRQGYEFDYWEGSKYYAGQEYTITENHTFKAIWKRPSSNNYNYNPAHVVPDTSAK